jgi:hypothetical protein
MSDRPLNSFWWDQNYIIESIRSSSWVNYKVKSKEAQSYIQWAYLEHLD